MTARQHEAPDCAGRNGAHTPGPWVIDPCWDILGNTDDGNGMVCQITTDAVPRAEAEANARPIAAAPELLDACLAVVDCCASAPPAEIVRRLDAAASLCATAIAKAGGRQS